MKVVSITAALRKRIEDPTRTEEQKLEDLDRLVRIVGVRNAQAERAAREWDEAKASKGSA